MITSASAKANAIRSASASPAASPPPGAPSISATPPSAIAIASMLRRPTGSPSSTRASTAASTGEIAWMKSTRATVVWFSAAMNAPDAVARQTREADPGDPDRAPGIHDPAALGDRDVEQQGERGEQRAAGELGPDVERELALQQARRRPRNRRERDADLPAALPRGLVERGCGRHHHQPRKARAQTRAGSSRIAALVIARHPVARPG